ncbi:Yos1-like protein [Plasmodiophora brassicae]|uniref:Yos1-like protein n=1 Tax=Plasmodiophora brassicae TaxID=37360 RepID=A0A0G4IZ05_PLABS|nr:hypothetical protein PBRA_001609 [Plasmodiophora brassicae]SPQ93949.1 unnamed protein product [Plasmodiophora brassicae]
MALTIYSIIKACVLWTNAIAVLNEARFLRKYGLDRPTPEHSDDSIKNRIITLLYSARFILQAPLIGVNIFIIVIEILLG